MYTRIYVGISVVWCGKCIAVTMLLLLSVHDARRFIVLFNFNLFIATSELILANEQEFSESVNSKILTRDK